jgi:hypothetical protein
VLECRAKLKREPAVSDDDDADHAAPFFLLSDKGRYLCRGEKAPASPNL